MQPFPVDMGSSVDLAKSQRQLSEYSRASKLLEVLCTETGENTILGERPTGLRAFLVCLALGNVSGTWSQTVME